MADEIVNEIPKEVIMSELPYAKEYFSGLWGDYGRAEHYWKIICEYIKMLENERTQTTQ